MISLAVASLLVGALLAQRFKVMAVIPATAILLGVVLGAGLTNAHTVWSMMLTVGTAIASMQIGYLVIGSGVRHVFGGRLLKQVVAPPSAQQSRHVRLPNSVGL
jgi:hypothetical protein